MNQLAIALVGTTAGSSITNGTRKEDEERPLLEAIVGSWDDNNGRGGCGADIVAYEKLIADIGLRLMMHHRGNDVPSKNKGGGGRGSIPLSKLAPSVQSVREGDRPRRAMIRGDAVVERSKPPILASNNNDDDIDLAWTRPIDRGKHAWSAGPFDDRERMLELYDFEDWLGRCRPTAIGREGVDGSSAAGGKANGPSRRSCRPPRARRRKMRLGATDSTMAKISSTTTMVAAAARVGSRE